MPRPFFFSPLVIDDQWRGGRRDSGRAPFVDIIAPVSLC